LIAQAQHSYLRTVTISRREAVYRWPSVVQAIGMLIITKRAAVTFLDHSRQFLSKSVVRRALGPDTFSEVVK
jgi:hypothetical protein